MEVVVVTYRSLVQDVAFGSHGLVTLQDAQDVGVPAVEVHKLASRGVLDRLGKGVYRLVDAPHGELDEFAEAVALVGPEAVLADAAVLAAHHLGQINLRSIQVATAKQRIRHRLPPTVEVVRKAIPDSDRDDIDGIPAMTLASALEATRGRILPERWHEAVRKAAARELIGPSDVQHLLEGAQA